MTSRPNPVIFTITIPQSEVKTAYEKKLDAVVAQTELPGFRKGNAPRAMVEEKVGKKAIYSDVIEHIVLPAYQREATSRALKPMISPRLKPIALEENNDWQFEISVIQKPEVKLGDYEKILIEKLAPGKIVTPGKPEPALTRGESTSQQGESTRGGQTKEEKMRIAFDTLLEKVEIELPTLLVEEEVNARLSQLVDQVQMLGMTVDQYLSSKNLTADSLRQSYEKTAREMLKLNLALDKIASDQNFTEKDRIAKAIDWIISH